jgi:type II secretory pathway pseudopilin PulG
MKTKRPWAGYTIIEVMIFLAVSSFMFVVAAYFVQGKVANSEFTQAMNNINSNVQQVINNVVDDNYPPINNAQCSVANRSLTISQSNVSTEGANQQCIVDGQVIQFAVGSNPSDFNIYSVAACTYSNCSGSFTTGTQSTNLSQAGPTVIDPGTNDNCQNDPSATVYLNLTTCNQLSWGMHVTAMYDYNNGNIISTNSIGFFSSLAQNQTQGLQSSSQSVLVIDPARGSPYVNINNRNLDEKGMVSLINRYLGYNVQYIVYSPHVHYYQFKYTNLQYIANPYFVVCFSDGHGNVGELKIGGGNSSGSTGQRLVTNIKISQSTIYPFGSQYSNDACQVS